MTDQKQTPDPDELDLDETENAPEPGDEAGDDTTKNARAQLRAAKTRFAKAREKYAKEQEVWAAARRKFTEQIVSK